MSSKLWQKPYVLITILLFISILITGCNTSEYKTFTLKNGIAHFSFEYPSSYKVVDNIVSLMPAYTHIILRKPPNEEQMERITSVLSIYVDEAYTPLSVDSAISSNLSDISTWNDFKLLERSSIQVVGVNGQRIVYSWASIPARHGIAGEPIPSLAREVYFYQDGQLWNISISSDELTTEAAKADFEHVLRTFKILN